MPVYLCKPGCAAYEPWRHGIQVYAFPFAIDSPATPKSSATEETPLSRPHAQEGHYSSNAAKKEEEDVRDQPESEPIPPRHSGGVAIRRVRHAEVVLVDDVCIAHGRYWLRLRWPGPPGGFAGYIALGPAVSRSSVRQFNNRSTGNTSTRPLRSQPSGKCNMS